MAVATLIKSKDDYMKFKVIESTSMSIFEKELRDFCEKVEVLNIEFKPVCLVPDESLGWNAELVYMALVTYKSGGE